MIESIGAIFKNIRESKGLLLNNVTEETGINTSLLSRIENNKRLPTKEQVRILSKFYKAESNKLVVQWLSDKIFSDIKDEKLALEAIQIAEAKYKNKSVSSQTLTKVKPRKIKDIGYFRNKIIQGDCLDILKEIPNASIDMVLCDLPYGTTQNKWDSVIDLEALWKEYNRIVKPNGAVVLTSQGIFTAKLIMSNERNFKYKIVWIKSKATNFLNAKKQPLRKHEDICVFYQKQPIYNPQMTDGEAYDKGFRKNQQTGSYGDFDSTRVKSNGSRYPVDIINYAEDIDDFVYVKTAESEGEVLHPTQKPIELGRYLIKTFSQEGDIILDNASGSGSFLISAIVENRHFIGIEKNEDGLLHKDKPADYIDITAQRIERIVSNRKINNDVKNTLKQPILENHTLNYQKK